MVAGLGNERVLFRGKIRDVRRETVKGARGPPTIASFAGDHDKMEIRPSERTFNSWHNGEVVCTVPDLIGILSLDDGEPIGTGMVRYGLRVAEIGMPALHGTENPCESPARWPLVTMCRLRQCPATGCERGTPLRRTENRNAAESGSLKY